LLDSLLQEKWISKESQYYDRYLTGDKPKCEL